MDEKECLGCWFLLSPLGQTHQFNPVTIYRNAYAKRGKRAVMYMCARAIEEFEDIKGVIRIRISKKNRQHNGQKKKYKRTNNDLQTIHIKLKIE